MIYVVIKTPDLNLVQGLQCSEVVKCCNLEIMYRAGYKVHSSKLIISHLFLRLFCIIWVLFGDYLAQILKPPLTAKWEMEKQEETRVREF